tara:strand:+ start:530 stop:1303 length:774 start_codon:yes stop_codon:yes gene_type:complete
LNNLYFYASKILAPFINPINFLFLTLIILFILFSLFKKKNFYYLFIINLIALSLIAFFPIGKIGLKYLESDYIDQKPLDNIKNIIVLSGSVDLNSTIFTNKLNVNASSERLISSVKLANKYKSSKIFYLGGDGNMIKKNLSEIDVAKKFYRDVNFNLNKVIFLDNSRNTIENFKQLVKFDLIDNQSILITSAFHMKRSIMISKKLDLDLIPYAVDFRSISKISLINTYQNFNIASNFNDFNLFFRETLGIAIYKIFI